jgi:WD40 repeat protein
VSASLVGAVLLWDARSGEMIRRLGTHNGGVFGIAFLPDGETLVTASADGTLALWDAAP